MGHLSDGLFQLDIKRVLHLYTVVDLIKTNICSFKPHFTVRQGGMERELKLLTAGCEKPILTKVTPDNQDKSGGFDSLLRFLWS